MANAELVARIATRLESTLFRPDPARLNQLADYCELLAKWNRRINLTALPLDGFPASTLERLIVEPLAVLGLLAQEPLRWFDFGSGGGSPAIPIKILRPDLLLEMVEATAKKGAFLREVLRSLGISGASVWTGRIEELDKSREAQLVTMRAVRLAPEVGDAARRILVPGGQLVLFGTEQPPSRPQGFLLRASVVLPTNGHRLHVLERIGP